MNATPEPSPKRLWPVWVAIGLPLLLVCLISTPLAPNFVFVVIGIPVLLVLWACLGILALISSLRRWRHRDWSGAVAGAVLPVVILVAGVQFREFIHLCNYSGDVVHFIARRSSYLKKIRAVPLDGEPRLFVSTVAARCGHRGATCMTRAMKCCARRLSDLRTGEQGRTRRNSVAATTPSAFRDISR